MAILKEVSFGLLQKNSIENTSITNEYHELSKNLMSSNVIYLFFKQNAKKCK